MTPMDTAHPGILAGIAIASHYTASLVQMLLHRGLGHRPARAYFFEVHTYGHHASYGAGALRSERYLEPERKITPLYVLPAIALAALGYAVLPIAAFLALALGLAASFGAHIYLHTHYHLERSWLTRFAWFRRRRALHDVHHVDHSVNFAVVDFFWDRLLGTYAESAKR